MPIRGGGGSSGGGSVTAAAIEATFTASGQIYQGTGSGTGAQVLPPGFEIAYSQITSPVNIVSLTEATGTTIISPGAITFDGGTVIVEFFGTVTTPSGASDTLRVSLFESTTQITRLATVFTNIAAFQALLMLSCRYRFTPTAGSHTYTITASVNSTTGTPAVTAGAGGTGGDPPAFVRFTKV